MAQLEKHRGFRLIKQQKFNYTTTTLLAQNESRYVVMVNVIVMGVLLRNRHYEFSCKEQAKVFFQKYAMQKASRKGFALIGP